MSLSVLALVPHPQAGASARYRAYQMAPALAGHGVHLEVHALLDDEGFAAIYRRGSPLRKAMILARGCRRRWADLAQTGRYPLVLVHREVWPLVGHAALDRLAAHQPRWVYDFDDSVWLPNVSDANRLFVWMKPRDQFAWLAKHASAVAAGNAWLAEWARAHRPGRDADQVRIVPTAVDTVHWSPRARGPGPLRMVWIGSHSTVRYLEPLRPFLGGLATRHPGLELHVIGARFASRDIRVVEHPWSLEGEVAATAACDVGLAPLPDDQWTRGKCGLKLLLYMSLGLAAVASRVGVHEQILKDGVNGRLAGSIAEFVDVVDGLLDDAGERRRLGGEARVSVERDYSVQAVAPVLAGLLLHAAGR